MPCDHDYVETALETIVGFAKGTNGLIVLDDCASSQTVKNRTSELPFHDSGNAATHEHCETLQNESLRGGVLLHRLQGRSQGHLRKLPLRVPTGGEKNFEEGKIRQVGNFNCPSVHTQSRDTLNFFVTLSRLRNFSFEMYYNKWNGNIASRGTPKRVLSHQNTSTRTPPRKTSAAIFAN